MEEQVLKLRPPQIGDQVTIHNTLCEWDRHEGPVIAISGRPDDDMPVMVQRANFDTWPFGVHELELRSLEDEAYEGGWIDPYRR
jgi:hypothetical protein